MTAIDFHPDELLEREQAGSLSTADQRRLSEHLTHCTSCRIERQLRADFELELGVQTAPDMLQTLVSGALRAAGASARSPQPRARSRAARFRRPLAVVLATGVALGTALAAAQPDIAVRALDVVRERVNVLLGRGAGRNSTPRSDAAPADLVPSPRHEPTAVSAATDAVAPRAIVPEPDATRSATKKVAAPRLGAAALFDRANAARSTGSRAEALYEELQARYPESAEARLSLAILGRMKLDAGDARTAIAHFESYLTTGDRALREQAMAGCALGWTELGRVDQERQSWRELLAAYPDSSYASLARQRLERKAR